jgi:hypothetical protein
MLPRVLSAMFSFISMICESIWKPTWSFRISITFYQERGEITDLPLRSLSTTCDQESSQPNKEMTLTRSMITRIWSMLIQQTSVKRGSKIRTIIRILLWNKLLMAYKNILWTAKHRSWSKRQIPRLKRQICSTWRQCKRRKTNSMRMLSNIFCSWVAWRTRRRQCSQRTAKNFLKNPVQK